MANVPSYSQFIAIKKVQAIQTANTNTSIIKNRAPSPYISYFPLYNVHLSANALLYNKFTQTVPPPKYVLDRLLTNFDTSNTSGEPTNMAYDGVDTIYASCYFPTTSGVAITQYNIATRVASTFLTKSNSLVQSTYGLAYDSVRSCMYVGNLGAGTIAKVTVPDKVITSLTTGITAVYQLALDATNGFIYAISSSSHVVYRVNVTDGTKTVFAGLAGTSGTADGSLTNARFNSPTGIVYDPTGPALYVADSGNFTIRKIDITTSQVSTIAGSAGNSGNVEGIGSAARFRAIRDLSIDTVGQRIFATETNDPPNTMSIIRQISLATFSAIRIAGIPGVIGNVIPTNKDALLSTFNLPRGSLYVSPHVYVADTRNNDLKRITFN